MDRNPQQLADDLGDLPWDDASGAAHRDGLESDLLAAWAARKDSDLKPTLRGRMLTQAGRTIMTSRIVRYGAVAASLALVVVGLSYLPGSPHPIAQPAWGIEKAIAAMEDVRTVYLAGAGGVGERFPFEFWAKRDPRTNQLSFHFESPDEVCYFLDGVGYCYMPGEATVTQFTGMSLTNVKYLAAAMQMQLWLRGQALAILRQHCAVLAGSLRPG